MKNLLLKRIKKIAIAVLSTMFVICFGLTFKMMPKTAYANGNPEMTIQVSQETAKAGDTVQVKISLVNNPGVASLKLNVTYEDFLTLGNIEYNSLLGGQATSSNYIQDGSPATLIWVNAFENFTNDGVFATLTFKIDDDVADDSFSEISISYNPADIYNVDETDIDLNVINGYVYVTSCVAGDINGDGNVNNKDITRLFQYLANWDVTVNEDALDVNGDGSINNKDITRLFQYLANWDVKVYVRKPCIVTFNGNGGTLVSGKESQAVRRGGSAVAPVYERNGYTFEGFDVDLECITENVIVTAIWEQVAHIHDYTATLTPPTCIEQGYTTYVCSGCGDSYIDDYTAELGHNYSAWTVTTEPTCTSKGIEMRVCTHDASHVETREVDELGHNYVATVIVPTCTEQGYTSYTCLRCGDSYLANYVEEMGHIYSDMWTSDEDGHWHVPICGHTNEEAGIADYAEHEHEGGVCKICGAIQKVEVIFWDNDGSIISIQRVKYGGNAVAPTVSDKEDYYFDRWIGNYANLTENVEVIASYKKYFKVRFYDYEYNVLETKKAKNGYGVIAPNVPEREGYDFTGWSESFDSVIEDMEIIAQYEIKTYEVVFKMPNDNTIETQTIAHGLSAVEPSSDVFKKYYCAPNEKIAKAFSGWYYYDNGIKKNIEQLSEFKIVKDMTVYAEYENAVDKPIIVLKLSKGEENGTTKTYVNMYFTMPAEQNLFAIDLRIDWTGANIENFSESDIPNTNGDSVVSKYSNKNKYFTLSFANASGISINGATNSVLTITFKGDIDNLILSADSTFIIGESFENNITMIPEMLIVG